MKSNKIVGIVIGVILVALLGIFVISKTNPELLPSMEMNTNSNSNSSSNYETYQGSNSNPNSNSEAVSSTSSSTDLKTDIVAPKPVNGTRKAIIELGSTGFNRFVIVSDNNKRYVVEDKTFGQSYAKEGLTSKSEVLNTLRGYISETLNKFNIDKKNVHFVVSSGASKEQLIVDIANELKKSYFVNIATPQQEATYALNAMVLDEYKNKAIYVDIGGGNTKFAWYENGVVKTRESFGAKFSQDNTKNSEVIVSISNIMKDIPQANKQYLFVIGGIPNKLASIENVGERYQYMRNDYNIDQLFKDNKDYQRIQNGWLILKTIQEGAEGIKTVYDYDANFSLGFLTSLK